MDEDLNLRQLRYLLAVVDHGHFGRAAQVLHISTPSLSQQVRKLEAQVGATLIDRNAHPLRPTAAGEPFIRESRECLAAARRAFGAVAAHERAVGQRLRVGFVSSAGGPLTRAILVALTHAVPGVVTDLVQLDWPAQITAVLDHSVDASFGRLPIFESGVLVQIVLTEPRVAVLAADHRLAHRTQLSIDELRGERQVTDDRTDPRWQRWWSVGPRPDGTPVSYGPVVHTMDEMLEAIAGGQAIGFTARSVRDAYRRPGIAFVPVTDIEPSQLALCTRRDDTTPVISALRRTAQQLT